MAGEIRNHQAFQQLHLPFHPLQKKQLAASRLIRQLTN